MKLFSFTAVLLLTAVAAATAQADDYAEAWGPAIGSTIELAAPDQTGAQRTVADLSGDKGLILFLNRSADW